MELRLLDFFFFCFVLFMHSGIFELEFMYLCVLICFLSLNIIYIYLYMLIFYDCKMSNDNFLNGTIANIFEFFMRNLLSVLIQ